MPHNTQYMKHVKLILRFLTKHFLFLVFFPLGLAFIFAYPQKFSSLVKTIQRSDYFLSPLAPTPTITPIRSDFLLNAINSRRRFLIHPALDDLARDFNQQIIDSADIQTEVNLNSLAQKYQYRYSVLASYSFFATYQSETELADLWFSDSSLSFRNPEYTHLGISLIPTTLESHSGYLITFIFAHPYTPPPTPTPVVISEASLLAALNTYRSSHQRPALSSSESLCLYARERVREHLARYPDHHQDPLDSHLGFIRDTSDTNHAFELTGFSYLIENLAFTPSLVTPAQIIEWGWDSSLPHRQGQLSEDITHACVSGVHPFYAAIFGK